MIDIGTDRPYDTGKPNFGCQGIAVINDGPILILLLIIIRCNGVPILLGLIVVTTPLSPPFAIPTFQLKALAATLQCQDIHFS